MVDGAYGTGFRGTYAWPAARRADGGSGRVPVLAIDIPSGVDGVTGAAGPEVGRADATVTFAALKPGLLFEPGAGLAGDVVVADIGLDVAAARVHLVEEADVAAWWPTRSVTSHKWQAAVWVVAGAPGMGGAAALASGGAQRAGAGYVRLSSPGGLGRASTLPVEVVQHELAGTEWASSGARRPGSVRRAGHRQRPGHRRRHPRPDPSRAGRAGPGAGAHRGGCRRPHRPGPEAEGLVGPHTILTPHDGEFARLDGGPPGADRLGAARRLAERLGCVVLLKGGPTVVAGPGGDALVVATGDARLASAGTGDVLAGVIGGPVRPRPGSLAGGGRRSVPARLGRRSRLA